MNVWVLVAGRLVVTPALLALPRPDLVVAADGGARHAAVLGERLGVQVDAWVGDFDSSGGVQLDAPREVHPRAKDSTDGELALAWARAQGADRVTMLGAFGGRFDHTFALALGALRASLGGLPVTLHSGDESGHPLLPGVPLTLRLARGQVFSVLAASELHGLTITGARWTLQHVTVPPGSGLTISNEALGSGDGQSGDGQPAGGHGPVTARLDRGAALVTVLHPPE